MTAAEFNVLYPVGTAVRWWPVGLDDYKRVYVVAPARDYETGTFAQVANGILYAFADTETIKGADDNSGT